MIHDARTAAATFPRPYKAGDVEHSPLLVFYEITNACDLVCQHCRACAQPLPRPSELSPAESRRLVKQLLEFPRTPMLILTGGDPLKRGDIYDLVDYARQLGVDVSITPSATPLVTPQAIERLARAGVSRMALSLDGATAATHDSFRGVQGSFQRTLEILREARAAGIPLQVNTTVTPANLHELDSLAALMERQQIVLWSVFFLVPTGRALAHERLTAQQCEEVFERLASYSRRYSYAIKTTEAPHYRRYMCQHAGRRDATHRGPRRPTNVGINDGKGIMFVNHSGLIHPSGFLPMVAGVFPRQRLVDVYQNSELMRALRDTDRLGGKCGHCEFRNICGGSRARAYAVTGDLFAQEPDCNYVPAAMREYDATAVN